MKKLNLSLNLKLIGITLFTFAAMISLITFKEYKTIKNEMLRHKKEIILHNTDQLKHTVEALMLKRKAHDLAETLQRQAYESNTRRLLIFTPGDRVVKASAIPREAGKPLSREHYNLYKKFGHETPFFLEEKGVPNIAIFNEIENSYTCHKCHPSGQRILGVIFKQSSLSASLAGIRRIILDHVIFSLLAAVFFGCIFSYIVFRLIDDPLEKIMETIKSIEQGDLDKQVDVKSMDIIGKLAEKFNNMTAKIREARDEVDKLHRKQMERASELALIGEISSGIAHEVKNPLACISSALQVIDRETAADSENKAVIQEVLNQVRRLDHTVKRILEFARPAKAPKTIVDIDKVLEGTFIFLTNFAGQRSIEVNIVRGEGMKKIMADGQALRQVLLNICLNGIEAMQEKGTLTISTGLRAMNDNRAKGDYCEISIRDTGAGIAPEHLALIFDPFFTTKEKGTGLGLAISMNILEEHRGFVEVDSKPGAGTTFRIYLPAAEEN